MENLNLINKIKNKSGFSPIIIAVIAVAVLLVAGAVYYFVFKKPAGEGGQPKEKALEELIVSSPGFDLSFSPLPALKSSALNLLAPSLLSGNIFSGFSVNTDFSYKGDTTIKAPDVPFSYTPSNQTSQQDQGQQQQGVNAASCAQFSSIPSAQYCSMVSDSSGRALCEQCKAAGF